MNRTQISLSNYRPIMFASMRSPNLIAFHMTRPDSAALF